MEEDKSVSTGAAEETAKKTAEGDPAASKEAQLAAQITDMAQEAAKLTTDIQALQAENAELKDKNLRVVAEMENFRRRTERDKAEFSKYAISEFARDIVGVGDNIRRAIEAVPKDAVAMNPTLRSLVEGVEVTERELLKVLERFQVTRFDPLGEAFNPHLHDAMTKVEVPNVPAETVVQVIHAGYMIGERVLRPAAVIVAKGGGAVEQAPKAGGGEAPPKEDSIPLGAMRIPDDAVSSASEAAFRSQLDMQQTVFGRSLSNDKRRPSLAADALSEERVAHFKRGRQGGGGGGGHEAPRQQSAPAHKPTSLVKPVIPKSE